ncbi:condensation domain-containing protein [Edaphobacter flagellatus]|uniref:condensation domain-containing protein n=1 Tax=Edaphobacter flagellatus TaxID=1933044 RepID=UPI0021B3FF20|nr:condensation domain-containing protein [Edaphobacter flagellatus]
MGEGIVERNWLDLSLAQQAVWLDAKLNGNMILQLGGWSRIPARLEEAYVRQAMSLVMARHDALRLRVDNDRPRQWLDSSIEAPLRISPLPDSYDVDEAFRLYLQQYIRLPMPLGDHPLFGLELVEAGDNACYLIWRFHHLIADSVSTSLAMQYWTEAYLALTTDEPRELSPPTSYLPGIEADKEYLASTEYKQDLAYWVARFTPLPPPLVVDDRETDETGIFFADWTLSGELWECLQKLASDIKIAPFRILFAIFAAVSAEHYGQSDLVTAMALHRRDQSSRLTLGMFSGVMPVRFYVASGKSFLETVQGYSAQIDADLRHKRIPVDHLARVLELFRHGRSRLFDIVMSFLPADRVRNHSVDDEWSIRSGVVAVSEASPISLHVTELDSMGLQIRVSVNTRIVDPSAAEALLSRMQYAVRSSAHAPNISVDHLFSGHLKEHATVESRDSNLSREEWIV